MTYKALSPKAVLVGLALATMTVCVGFGIKSTTAGSQGVVPAQQPDTLSQVKFGAAALAPYFRQPAKKGGKAYFVLSREATGSSKGTYDFFGGKRDPGENHPSFTAAREGSEESVFLLGKPGKLRSYIDSNGKNTRTVVVRKGYVAYLTQFKPEAIMKLRRNFSKALKKTTNHHLLEKDRLALVTWQSLKQAVATAPSPLPGPLTINAQVLDRKGRAHGVSQVQLRPVVVGTLRSYFQGGANCYSGKNPKVHFCQ